HRPQRLGIDPLAYACRGGGIAEQDRHGLAALVDGGIGLQLAAAARAEARRSRVFGTAIRAGDHPRSLRAACALADGCVGRVEARNRSFGNIPGRTRWGVAKW